MPNITYRREESKLLLPIYSKIRDVLMGPSVVKSRGTKYLPNPEGNDTKDEYARKRYDDYITRAMFYDAVSRTQEGYIGQMFYREPDIDLPPLLKVLEDDVDGTGVGLLQQVKQACEEVLPMGRAGIFIDYSNQPDRDVSLADQQRNSIRPTITLCKPEDILNWRWTIIGSRKYLSLVVFQEEYDINDDGYEIKKGIQIRDLSLVWDEKNIESPPKYRSRIWRDDGNLWKMVYETFPTTGRGSSWDYIPFYFMGSKNNDPIPDRPPFEGLAELAIGHYRNSADYEESVYLTGQPTPYVTNITEQWAKEVWGDKGFKLGSRAFIPLPQGSTAGLLQAQPNGMAKEAMEIKERQMVALGAKLAEQKTVQRTATETEKESVIENSTLSNVAQNVGDAYKQALRDCAIYQNIPPQIDFELNTDFEIVRMSSQDRQQLLAEWQAGGITWEEYRWNMKRSGVAFEEDDKAKAKIEKELGPDLKLDDLTTKLSETVEVTNEQ